MRRCSFCVLCVVCVLSLQVANIYVTVASGSIISALQEILDDPTSVRTPPPLI